MYGDGQKVDWSQRTAARAELSVHGIGYIAVKLGTQAWPRDSSWSLVTWCLCPHGEAYSLTAPLTIPKYPTTSEADAVGSTISQPKSRRRTASSFLHTPTKACPACQEPAQKTRSSLGKLSRVVLVVVEPHRLRTMHQRCEAQDTWYFRRIELGYFI